MHSRTPDECMDYIAMRVPRITKQKAWARSVAGSAMCAAAVSAAAGWVTTGEAFVAILVALFGAFAASRICDLYIDYLTMQLLHLQRAENGDVETYRPTRDEMEATALHGTYS